MVEKRKETYDNQVQEKVFKNLSKRGFKTNNCPYFFNPPANYNHQTTGQRSSQDLHQQCLDIGQHETLYMSKTPQECRK